MEIMIRTKKDLLRLSIIIMVTATPWFIVSFLIMLFLNPELGYTSSLYSLVYFGIGASLRKIYHMLKNREEKPNRKT